MPTDAHASLASPPAPAGAQKGAQQSPAMGVPNGGAAAGMHMLEPSTTPATLRMSEMGGVPVDSVQVRECWCCMKAAMGSAPTSLLVPAKRAARP